MADEAPKTDEAIVPAAPEVKRSDFVDTFIVRDGELKYEVAANAVANRALMQMNVAKLRALCARTLKVYYEDENLTPSARELKTLVDAVSMVEEMSATAYSDTKHTDGLGNAIERIVHAATRGAVSGVTNPASQSRENRLMRMLGIAKKHEKQVISDRKVIDIE